MVDYTSLSFFQRQWPLLVGLRPAGCAAGRAGPRGCRGNLGSGSSFCLTSDTQINDSVTKPISTSVYEIDKVVKIHINSGVSMLCVYVMILCCFRTSEEVVCSGGCLPAAGPAQAGATELHRTHQGRQGGGNVTTGSLPAMRWRHRALPATVPHERARCGDTVLYICVRYLCCVHTVHYAHVCARMFTRHSLVRETWSHACHKTRCHACRTQGSSRRRLISGRSVIAQVL